MRWRRVMLSLALVAAAGSADARKRARTAPARASKQTVAAIEELMGDFKWGMTVEEVQKVVLDRLKVEYGDRIRTATSQWEQQKLRDDLERKIKEFRDSYVQFTGLKTGWDVSVIDKEFAHNNDEATFYVWEQDQRRFFFFYQGKLYKLFLALSQAKFQGKAFEEFSELIQARYGPAQRLFSASITGEPVFDRLQWPRSGATIMEAVDQTGFYGSYGLALYDAKATEAVVQGRRISAEGGGKAGSVVDEALSGGGGPQWSVDETVVDRITGRAAEGVDPGLEEEGAKDLTEEEKRDLYKRRKAAEVKVGDNPLGGVE